MAKTISDQTIQTVARSIYREALGYGFGPVDIIRMINALMDLCQDDEDHRGPAESTPTIDFEDFEAVAAQLPIEGTNVKIRAFVPESDVELLEKWLPDKYGRYFMLSCATAQTATIDSLISSPANVLGIITLKDDRPIGAMAYLDHNTSQKRAELRKMIGDVECRGRGLAEEATRLWLAYGVQALGLEKIYVSTLQTHIRNIKLNEDVGFKVEGLLRNEVVIDGQRHDVLRMGIWAG